MTANVNFTVVLRGYDITEIEAFVAWIQQALDSQSASLRAEVREAPQNHTIRVRLRGYDRPAVDDYFRQAIKSLA